MDERLYNGILIGILAISLGLLFFANVSAITGHAVSDSTISNVSISKYLAILMSDDLDDGIYFGSVEVLPTISQNATENYNGVGSSTLYYINVSNDSNTAVDFCIKALDPLTMGAVTMNLENETFSVGKMTNSSDPRLVDEVSLELTYPAGEGNANMVNVTGGEASYWRFWLDIPATQEAGTYNNTIQFKAMQIGLDCTTA